MFLLICAVLIALVPQSSVATCKKCERIRAENAEKSKYQKWVFYDDWLEMDEGKEHHENQEEDDDQLPPK